MWRVRGCVFATHKPRAAAAKLPPSARHLLWQRQDFRLAKQLATFSSKPSHRSIQHQDDAEAEAKTAATPKFSQGDEAMKITRVGMYVNVAMAATKGAVGLVIHSSALVADAAHSLSDLLSDVVTLWSVKVARLPPDPRHPYGYGKYEAVGSLSVGAILVLCGLGIGADGMQAMQEIWNGATATSLPDFNLPFLSEIEPSTQWALALSAAGVSIAAKEALYRATVKIGKQANSKVLIANAWHHRTDAISSVVALGGIVGSMAGVPLLDPVAGMAVAAMIVKTGGEICLDSVQELTDNTVEAEVLETLQEVSRGVDDVLHVSQVRARRMGPYTLVDLRVHLDARTSISMAQQISKRVRSHILQEVPDVSEVLVHIDVQFSQCAGASTAEFHDMDIRPYKEIKNDISYALATIPEITGTTHINTHWLPHLGGQGTVVDVAIIVQPDLKVGAANGVAKKARKAIEAIPYIVEADIHLELQDDDSEQSLAHFQYIGVCTILGKYTVSMGERGIIMDFVLASAATSGACVVSNPMEVIKTRMQLQGELAHNVTRGAAPAVQYRNFAHAFYTIGRTEGLRGIQRGLGPGISYQVFMNGPRLGLFEPMQKVFGATDPTSYSFPVRNVCAAATSGMIGAFIGSPFFLVKARIQAASSAGKINAQYAYNGMMDGFRQIVKADGLTGLYRGATASIPRVAIGSGTQLATYTQAKMLVLAAGCEDGVQVHLGSSILTGLVVTTAMNPMDVVSTRIYSQKVVNGKGKLYSGVMDCITKTMKSEGIRGFYKGWAAHYMRLGPHTIFTFLFWEEAKKIAAELGY